MKLEAKPRRNYANYCHRLLVVVVWYVKMLRMIPTLSVLMKAGDRSGGEW